MEVTGGSHAAIVDRAEEESFHVEGLLLPQELKKGKGPFRERFACRYKEQLFHHAGFML
jgi:hypothetical protein